MKNRKKRLRNVFTGNLKLPWLKEQRPQPLVRKKSQTNGRRKQKKDLASLKVDCKKLEQLDEDWKITDKYKIDKENQMKEDIIFSRQLGIRTLDKFHQEKDSLFCIPRSIRSCPSSLLSSTIVLIVLIIFLSLSLSLLCVSLGPTRDKSYTWFFLGTP